jgi:glucose/arabinose dehydrogenase
MKKSTILLSSFALCTVGGALAWQQMASKLPPPYATPSANNRPHVISRPNGAQLQVPSGFAVEEYASGFQTPRVMIYGPSGEILITESVDNGGVTIVATNGKVLDPGARKKIITGLERPYGLAWYQDWLYVGEPSSIKRYKYDAKTMTAGKGQEVVSYPGMNRGHWTRSLAIDPKAQKLYVGVGSGSNVSPGEPKERAAINRYNLDGSGYETYASGTRNPTAIHFYPGTEQLWASVQERDALGDDLVPDYFMHVQQGGFYGWPFAYFGPNEDPRNKGQQPDLVKKTITPDVSLGAHVAVIDWTFYTGKMFPQTYQGGAFLAFHGSWNREKRVGQSVAFVPFSGGKPTAPPQEFLKGWMLSPDKAEVWGRPTGVFQMQDGSLLVSDDGGNKIWRISYKQ